MTFLIAAHILSGALAVLAGAIAVATRKGGALHIRTGRGYVALMALSSLLGAGLGLIRFEHFFITFFAGLLATYLVLSGWRSARTSDGSKDAIDLALSTLNGLNFAALAVLGAAAMGTETSQMFGFAGENYLFLAAMSGVALIADLSRVFRETISRKHQIARHLWRMLLGFFIAAGSAFTGPGAAVFPEEVQASGLLSLPELLILGLMIVYLIKTLLVSKPRAPSPN